MKAALLVLGLLLLPAATLAQPPDPWFEKNWGVATVSKWSIEILRAEAIAVRDQLARLETRTDWDSGWEAYKANLEKVYANVRQALGEKGVRIPGISVSGNSGAAAAGAAAGAGGGSVNDPNWGRAGNTTQAIEAPNTARNSTRPIPRPGDGGTSGLGGVSLVLPLTVVLTAAQLAECNLRGVSFGDCAAAVGLQTAGGLAVGTLVTVLSASGKPLVAALATGTGIGLAGVATGAAVITTVYAGIEGMNAAGATLDARDAEALLQKHQALNIARLTPARLETMVQNVSNEAISVSLDFSALDSSARVPVALRQALDVQVAKARSALEQFNRLMAVVKAASDSCADAQKNPARLAAAAERGAVDTRRLADATVKAFAEARTMATPCVRDSAASAREAHALGTRRLAETSQSAQDVRDFARDATAFFPLVKAGREAVIAAAQPLAELQAIVRDAESLAGNLESRVESYTAERNATMQRHGRLVASVRALHDAFGPNAPAEVQATLARITALVPPVGPTLPNDELRRMHEATDTEVNRVAGLLANARSNTASMKLCAGITDVMPAELQALLNRVVTDVVSDSRRASAAAQAAADVPRTVEACLNTASRSPSAGWLGDWSHDYGTLTLVAPTDEASARNALRLSTGLGPAIPCGAGDTIVTGEITIVANAWGTQAVSAPVVGCLSNGALTGRFSNQNRLTAADAATGNIRAGRFTITLVASQTGAFQGQLWRWNQVTRQDFSGPQFWSGRKR